MLVLLKSGAQWRDKDLPDTVKSCELPPKITTRAGGYGSDRGSGYSSGGGYGSGAERRAEHVKKHTGKRDNKHYLLLTKPSLKYAVDECTDEWVNKAEPDNFEEFVISRQAMGDVLYQLKKNWQDDGDQNHCELCVKNFTSLGNRRHHCRSCGVLVCDKCSSKRLSLAVLPPSSSSVSGNDLNVGTTKERTCDACFNQLCTQVDNSQSANNRYCVKQLKASAEILVGHLRQFLDSLKGTDGDVDRNSRGSSSGKTNSNSRSVNAKSPRKGRPGGRNSRSGSRNFDGGRSSDDANDEGSDSDYGPMGSPTHRDRKRLSGNMSTPTKNGGNKTNRESDYGSMKLFTPPKQTVISRRTQGQQDYNAVTTDDSGGSHLFFCPGGSHHPQDGGPSSPVRLSLIENDVGLYKSLQHRHLIQQQVQTLLECDYLAQTFLDASKMYQVEAEQFY